MGIILLKSLIQAFVSGIDATFGDMLAKKETDNLSKKYGMYETLYQTITTIFYSTTIVLISPFVSVYTIGVKDLNYVNVTFPYVFSNSIYSIKDGVNGIIRMEKNQLLLVKL